MRADQPAGRTSPMAHPPARLKAFWKTGLFASQNGATKLRNRFILQQLTAEFGLDHDDAAKPD
jgi:hypothetical protein